MATQNPTGTGQSTPSTSSRGQNPSWWTDQHTQGWDRVKDNFRRDFESGTFQQGGAMHPGSSTSGGGMSSQQGAGTSRSVESGLGKQGGSSTMGSQGSPGGTSSMGSQGMGSQGAGMQTGGRGMQDWNSIEPAVRYGHGAYTQYGKDYNDWNDKLGDKLKTEWNDLKSGRTWDEVKDYVRRGWDSARRKI